MVTLKVENQGKANSAVWVKIKMKSNDITEKCKGIRTINYLKRINNRWF